MNFYFRAFTLFNSFCLYISPCCVVVQVEELRTKEALHERNMFSIAQENKKMSEPMRKAIDEVKRLKEEREAYRRDLQELAETKAHILVVQVSARFGTLTVQ